jgi:hypothetical protein
MNKITVHLGSRLVTIDNIKKPEPTGWSDAELLDIAKGLSKYVIAADTTLAVSGSSDEIRQGDLDG